MSKLNEILSQYGLRKLNSLTKYPSILTYHNLGKWGGVVDGLVDDVDFSSCEKSYVTEKVDGTNARIVFDGEDYIIGTKEELIYAKGDRIANPELNIVNTTKEIAERLTLENPDGEIRVLYGEVYGGNLSKASKQYTTDKSYGFRMFDVADVDLAILNESLNRIATWRKHGGQRFFNVDDIKMFAKQFGIDTVPYRAIVNGSKIPTDKIAVYQFLQEFIETQAGINTNGKSEGIVVRSHDRSLIRKIRFEDYEKTMKRENWLI